MKEQNQKKVEDQITKACKEIESQTIKAAKRLQRLRQQSPQRVLDSIEREDEVPSPDPPKDAEEEN